MDNEILEALKLTLYELKNKRFKKPSEFLDQEIKEVEALMKKYDSKNEDKPSDVVDIVLKDGSKYHLHKDEYGKLTEFKK